MGQPLREAFPVKKLEEIMNQGRRPLNGPTVRGPEPIGDRTEKACMAEVDPCRATGLEHL